MFPVAQKLILELSRSGCPARKEPGCGKQAALQRLGRWGHGCVRMRVPTPVAFPFSGQVGLIQLGHQQVLIQPLNSSQGSLSGQEHVIRRRWSLPPGPSTDTPVPGRLCQVLTGESGKPHHQLTAHVPRHRCTSHNHPHCCVPQCFPVL